MKDAVYNKIGTHYDVTRKADPSIVAKLIALLKPSENKRYLDLGCGSGNYTGSLVQNGLNIVGIDYSTEMLRKAQSKYPDVAFYNGDARQLPFENNVFNGAICILATHHISDNEKLFAEAYRVLKEGPLILFTATPEQMNHYWLNHYFPIMMADASSRMAGFDELKQQLQMAGFKTIRQEQYNITNQVQDLFLHAGKYRPELYLDPTVRNGISTFHLSVEEEELTAGLKQLERDIKEGHIDAVIENYENDLGDYLFVIADK